jgi:hypothetical protein
MVVNKSHEAVTCAQFQHQLADLISCDADLYAHPHLHHCSTCRRLIVDLEMIAEDVRRLPPGSRVE